MLDPLTLPPLPTLDGERITLRRSRQSDVDDRVCHPIDPDEEDGYGSAWRRAWDGRRYHTREDLMHKRSARDPSSYRLAIEYDDHCIGSAGLLVDPDEHCASYTMGVFVAALLGRETTRLVLAWGFEVLGLHRIQLEVLATNSRAISSATSPAGFARKGYGARLSFTQTGGRLHPDGAAAVRVRLGSRHAAIRYCADGMTCGRAFDLPPEFARAEGNPGMRGRQEPRAAPGGRGT
jgi:[ribosomal protein S5]-alanine N-acetyltransferase